MDASRGFGAGVRVAERVELVEDARQGVIGHAGPRVGDDRQVHFFTTFGRLVGNSRYVGGVIAQTFYVAFFPAFEFNQALLSALQSCLVMKPVPLIVLSHS